ncbi:MAG: thiamine phosphate synthase [Rhodospirillales bacterium]|nr:thiamine phosphate synthase [Rhodospirillales bacterium]
MKPPACRLYLITPSTLPDPAAFGQLLAEALDADDVGCVQIRLKDLADDAIKRAVDQVRPIIQKRDIACLLNDRPDLARQTGCDGVHVGQDDAPYAEARNILGPDAIVGVTCHDSRDLALAAAEAGADYVAFGAFFPTTTKDAKFAAHPDILEWWSAATTVPCVAIGGITAQNCAPLVRAGADFLAVSGGVWAHPQGPAAGVKAINAAIRAAQSD